MCEENEHFMVLGKKILFFILELLLNALLFSLVLTCYYPYCSLPSPHTPITTFLKDLLIFAIYLI